MPYGYYYPKRTNGNITQLWTENGVSSSRNPFTVEGVYAEHAKTSFNRSGTNTPSKDVRLANDSKQAGGRLDWVAVKSNSGPRLGYKIWNKKLGKFVWARSQIYVWRLVRKKAPKFQKVLKGMSDLNPNRLDYNSSSVSYFGDDLIVTSKSADGIKVLTMKGALWAPFTPYSSNYAAGVNADNYIRTGVTSRFDEAAAAMDASLINKLYTKVKNQHVNLVQVFAERKQTEKLVLDVFKRLAGFYKYARKGNLAQGVIELFPRDAKGLADARLAYVYGIKPLLQDLQGAVAQIAEPTDVYYDIIVQKTVDLPWLRVNGETGMTYGITRLDDNVYSNGKVTVKYKVRLKLETALDSTLSKFTQLGFSNLPQLVWELTPFSFVADWFIPIGNYLSNADAFSNFTVVHATRTVFCEEYITFRRTFGGYSSGFTTSSGSTGFVNKRIKCSRSVLTTIPTLRIPELKNPYSSDHLMNAVALAKTLRK